MQKLFGEITELIQQESGLTVSHAHKGFMESYILRRMNELKISSPEDFYENLRGNRTELTRLINEAAINETYFFREQQQFIFLKDEIFPGLRNCRATIWSAACATGEEALSLYALAKSCGLNFDLYATDIDTTAIEKFSKGIYTSHSFRQDGKEFHSLIERLGKMESRFFTVDSQVTSQIRISKFNLVNDTSYPVAENSVDIIFLRNAFIYFTPEIRCKIMQKMITRLRVGGILLLSVNEVASVDCLDSLPLIKVHSGTIYFYKKITMQEKLEYIAKRDENISIRKAFSCSMRTDGSSEMKNTFRKDCSRLQQNRISAKNINESSGKKIIEKNHFMPTENSSVSAGIEDFFCRITELIGQKKYDEAEHEICSFIFRPQNIEYKYYLEGLIFVEKNLTEKAEDCFSRSSYSNPKFWPALFSLGLLYKKNNQTRKMQNSFRSCKRVLDNYIREEKTCYNFITKSFSPSYFLTICEANVEDK